jgi:hypothetical protein
MPSAVSVLSDPFGMGDFGSHDSGDPSQQELENAIGLLDKRLLEMKVRQSVLDIFIYKICNFMFDGGTGIEVNYCIGTAVSTAVTSF